MRAPLLLAVFAVLTAFCVVNATAEPFEVGKETPEETVQETTAVNVVELTNEQLMNIDERIVNGDSQAVSVPEPTAFGLIAFGLAVGGGLMIRRKR